MKKANFQKLLVGMVHKVEFNSRLSTDEIAEVCNRSIYRGAPQLRQLAYLKKEYKGKNENGGRACRMTTPAQYKNRPDPVCIAWGTMREGAPVYVPAPNKLA